MSVQTPVELAYYYECSYGDFRLTYHIPIEILTEMVEQEKIAAKALRDYPDGIDLGCYPPDYDEFEKRYKYRPPVEPEPARRAFKTLMSSLEDWDTFRGSGFMSAEYLEGLIPKVEKTLQAWETAIVEAPTADAVTEEAPPPDTRQQVIQQAEQEKLEDHILKAIPLEAITTDAPQTRQELAPKMDEGESAPSVFTRAHKGERKQTDDL